AVVDAREVVVAVAQPADVELVDGGAGRLEPGGDPRQVPGELGDLLDELAEGARRIDRGEQKLSQASPRQAGEIGARSRGVERAMDAAVLVASQEQGRVDAAGQESKGPGAGLTPGDRTQATDVRDQLP